MNLKLIDGVIARYVDVLDEGDARRLKFFRELWGALEEGACAAEQQVYALPSKKELERLLREGPRVRVRARARRRRRARLRGGGASATSRFSSGYFTSEIAGALERVKWDRVIAATDVARAGEDPAAWLADLSEVLVDDGMTEQGAHLSALLASMALKAQLEGPAAQVMRSLKQVEGASIRSRARCAAAPRPSPTSAGTPPRRVVVVFSCARSARRRGSSTA